ncbi:MAG TPA: tRNA 2-selenouridine(34) synthase MnmH [Bacteroidia bacterium]|jgi:tRNA 2-selenouridine synthase|nr:tRNA 2-selenouridine(34) synthase MnmH [Bacteroidia bacterium]
MSLSLPITDFLLASVQIPVIDVRSPGEFDRGHIPGAHNIPLFTNEERARVGTVYKKQGKDDAVLLGLELVGPKMVSFVREARALAVNNKVLVHCWRGGMRSGSFAWLLQTAGLETTTLKQGYKAYRRHVLNSFSFPFQLIVLGGETGSGKTEILSRLKEQGEQVVDLEALANHKGSAFGALGQQPQPAVEQFENLLYTELNLLDKHKRIWVEDESKSIGRVFIPPHFWVRMKEAPLLKVEIPKAIRVQRLLHEYGNFTIAELEAAVLRIQKRLGGLATKQCMEALQVGDLQTVTEITLAYYDKAYNHPHADKSDPSSIQRIPIGFNDPVLAAQTILQQIKPF